MILADHGRFLRRAEANGLAFRGVHRSAIKAANWNSTVWMTNNEITGGSLPNLLCWR